MDKRRAKESTALLSDKGYIRLSSDLLPADARKKKLRFAVMPLPKEKQLVFRIVTNGEGKHLSTRAAMWSNAGARCPLIAVRAALRFLNVPLPKSSTLYDVEKGKNGDLVVQF